MPDRMSEEVRVGIARSNVIGRLTINQWMEWGTLSSDKPVIYLSLRHVLPNVFILFIFEMKTVVVYKYMYKYTYVQHILSIFPTISRSLPLFDHLLVNNPSVEWQEMDKARRARAEKLERDQAEKARGFGILWLHGAMRCPRNI